MLLKKRSLTEKSIQEIIPLTIIGQTVRTLTDKFKNYLQEAFICVTIQITYHFNIVMYRSGHFSPIVPPCAAGFASVVLNAEGLLWRKLESSKSLVLQVGGLKCCWQRHSVKPSC
jgi:hypothetical protein